MPSLNNVFPIPTGGAIGLLFTTATSGAIALSRAVSGSGGLGAFSTLYSGAPLSDTGEQVFFLDAGDATPAPLLNGNFYVYQLTDGNGTQQSQAVQTPYSIDVEQVQYTQVIIGLLQGAINTAIAASGLPAGIKWAAVMAAMPLAGNPPLPSIFVNPEIIAQQYVPVGQDDEKVGDLIQPGRKNNWTHTEVDRHMFRITVMSLSPEERDYYRDFTIAVLRVSVAYALSQWGADLEHSFEAVSYQEVDQTNLMIPGFYAADVLYSFQAMSNVKIVTNYNLINTITTTVSGYADTRIFDIGETLTVTTFPGSGTPVVDTTQVPTL